MLVVIFAAACAAPVDLEGDLGTDTPVDGTFDASAAVDAGRWIEDGSAAVPDASTPADASPPRDAGGPTDGADRSRVPAITFNWPARYGPSSGVDARDRELWRDLTARASVMSLQEAGWVAGYIRGQGWEVHRPNPPGDGDDQPTGNFMVWDPAVWRAIDRGAFSLSPYTRIQERAAGPTRHRPKYVVWVMLRNRDDGATWTFGSIHFVPSKHLGGAALALWELQRDRMLLWLGRQPDRTVVMGDFNAQPSDPPCAPIRDAARIQSAPSHGDRQIDWLVRQRALEGIRVEALPNLGQSDHRPVWGVVRWMR